MQSPKSCSPWRSRSVCLTGERGGVSLATIGLACGLAIWASFGVGVARWRYSMALLDGMYWRVLACTGMYWCVIGGLDGVARWLCSMALLDGVARWRVLACTGVYLACLWRARWRARWRAWWRVLARSLFTCRELNHLQEAYSLAGGLFPCRELIHSREAYSLAGSFKSLLFTCLKFIRHEEYLSLFPQSRLTSSSLSISMRMMMLDDMGMARVSTTDVATLRQECRMIYWEDQDRH